MAQRSNDLSEQAIKSMPTFESLDPVIQEPLPVPLILWLHKLRVSLSSAKAIISNGATSFRLPLRESPPVGNYNLDLQPELSMKPTSHNFHCISSRFLLSWILIVGKIWKNDLCMVHNHLKHCQPRCIATCKHLFMQKFCCGACLSGQCLTFLPPGDAVQGQIERPLTTVTIWSN